MKSTDLHISNLLAPGQMLGEALPVQTGGIMDRYGYRVYPIGPDAPDRSSNTVAIEVAGCSTETIHVLGGIAMSVQAIGGQGEVVVHAADGQRRIHTLGRELGAVSIGPGDTYQYLRAGSGDGPLVVLDTCRPAFKEGDEMSLEELSAEEGLMPGNRLLVWSPREPRQAHMAGAWHIGVEDYHDTRERNRAQSGSRGYRGGEPSHFHANIRRVGEADALKANVRLVGGTYEIAHRRPTTRAQSRQGDRSPISLQPHSVTFRQITAAT